MTRIERDAGTGRYVRTGTNKRRPKTTVTEPRPKKKRKPARRERGSAR